MSGPATPALAARRWPRARPPILVASPFRTPPSREGVNPREALGNTLLRRRREAYPLLPMRSILGGAAWLRKTRRELNHRVWPRESRTPRGYLKQRETGRWHGARIRQAGARLLTALGRCLRGSW